MNAKKAKGAALVVGAPTEAVINSIKGFDRDLKCRGFQFEIGKTYEHAGEVIVCKSGFHAVEGHPLEVFGYYQPARCRYTEAQQSGALSRSDGDSKVASARITIGVELHLHGLIQRAVKWVFDGAKPEEGSQATGVQGAASSTGYQGAASSTGNYGAASSTGVQGAASSTGYQGRVMGAEGNVLFLVYRDPKNGTILHAWAGIVGHDSIKPLVWYSLGKDGKPAEVTP